jgi:uncharacterized protein YbaR (Trm112 family)
LRLSSISRPPRFLPKGGKHIVLGLVTPKSGALKQKDTIKRRIDDATRFVDLGQLCLSPQCGFALTEGGNVLTEGEQWAKLQLIVEVARGQALTPRGFCPSCGGRRMTESAARLRPAVSQDRLRLLGDGRVLLSLKTAWADGTRHLLFEPLELLEKLAALTPRPRINLVLYHGVLGPHARWRARVVAYGALPRAPSLPTSLPDSTGEQAPAEPTHCHWAWAHLMQRAFELDVLACPRCGGRLRLIATVEDPREIREVLADLARSAEPVDRASPSQESFAANETADVCA